MRQWIGLACALAIGGCAAQQKTPMAWVRTDGQSIRQSVALKQQIDIDKAICGGEVSKASMQGRGYCRGDFDCAMADIQRADQADAVAIGCMAQKGYAFVPVDQADQKAAEFRATRGAARPQGR